MLGIGYGWRLSLFFGLIFAAFGLYQPYFPLWLTENGLTAQQISVILSAPVIVRIFATPYLSSLADRTGRARLISIVLAGMSALIFSLIATQSLFWPILILVMANAAFFAPLLPITEAIAMRGVRFFKLDYGRMRLWGSATFIIANIAGGIILERMGAGIAATLIAGVTFMVMAAAFMLPADDPHKPRERTKARIRDGWSVPREVLPAIIAGALIQSSHAVYYGFGSLGFIAAGYNEITVGFLWAAGIGAEILFFAIAGRFHAERVTYWLLIAGALGGVVRWLGTAMAPPLAVLILLQCLHALTFAATHYAVVREIGLRAGEADASRVQAMNFTITGIAMSLAMLAAGPLYDVYGVGAYFAPALLALAGLLAVLLLSRPQPQRAGKGG